MKRNIVLIILDAIRKDYFDDYAPRIQKLADVSFDQCRAASSCSVPSHGALLTGQLPHENGVTYTSVRYNNIELEDTFLDLLPEYRKFGVSANPWASSEFGFGDYFDEFINVSQNRRFHEGMDISHFVYDECNERGARLYIEFLKAALQRKNTPQTLANGAFAVLSRSLSKFPVPKPVDDGASIVCREIKKRSTDTEKPFFCFTNFMDAHSPMHHVIGYDRSLHDVPVSWSSLSVDNQDKIKFNIECTNGDHDDFISNYRQLYATSIDYLDRKVATLISDIESQTTRETTFIITSDHGENLGYESENYFFGHKSSLSEGLLHVPLYIINPPPGLYNETESRYFSQLRMGNLIESLATEEQEDVFGESVPAELINGYMDELEPFVPDEMVEYYSRAQRCVISDESKYQWDSLGGSAKYRLEKEQPNWQTEVSTDISIPAWAKKHFSISLEQYCKTIDKETSYADQDGIDNNTKNRLEDLGYL